MRKGCALAQGTGMKKNLMSILILALLVVNIVLTAIMMFSMMGAMKSTTALVGKIATVMDLELNTGGEANEIPMSDMVPYDLSDSMTIMLKSDDGEQHYVQLAVTLQMDKKNKDYKKYSETLATNQKVIQGYINEVISSHTLEEFKNDTDGIRNEVLARLQKEYDSDFIYKVVFSDVKAY